VSDTGTEDARAAGLRYSSDEEPGISRRKAGRGFSYRSESGGLVRGERQLTRIRALRIPPAWTGVWICADERGHLQATGRDARGRKQYLYHADWRALRDESKFDRMLEFGTKLPRLREQIESDLNLPRLPRERVIAAVLRLVDETLIRIGNEQYRRQNGSFGATTMRARHAHVEGRHITVEFKGKAGKLQRAELSDPRLARTLRQLQDLPGQALFGYLGEDDGERHPVRSDDVNDYLRDASGAVMTVKDFRTWGASALCLRALDDLDPPASATAAKRSVTAAIHDVAAALGNTPAVCRASYVHPAIIESFAAGDLPRTTSRCLRGLDRWESALLRFLRERG
jgi:DNA topoisomerase I